MTNGGASLETWHLSITAIEKRMSFMVTMLKQVIPCLQRLHKFGYSHGDMKPENICARPSIYGTFKFTLIDLGMCSKILHSESDKSKMYFRGNYVYCSAIQISNCRASAFDDLYSLACVAYTFIFGKLPWLMRARQVAEDDPQYNIYETSIFSKFRVKYEDEFDAELVASSGMLSPLF